jgi:hypothetical protein
LQPAHDAQQHRDHEQQDRGERIDPPDCAHREVLTEAGGVPQAS